MPVSSSDSRVVQSQDFEETSISLTKERLAIQGEQTAQNIRENKRGQLASLEMINRIEKLLGQVIKKETPCRRLRSGVKTGVYDTINFTEQVCV